MCFVSHPILVRSCTCCLLDVVTDVVQKILRIRMPHTIALDTNVGKTKIHSQEKITELHYCMQGLGFRVQELLYLGVIVFRSYCI